MAVSRWLTLICFGLCFGAELQALPIGFGRTQGNLEYQELSTENFKVYFDKRTPNEGRIILNSLEAAYPFLSEWMEIKRRKPLPVIMSATTNNPSFANFITDAIELQTLGQGGRDLAWHELTHNIMYMHLNNIFGHSGSIIHLPWMPAWWIEGLAEATSRSVGSDWQHGIERYYALNGLWPSYDKLHNLYRPGFAAVGYAISGTFVTYILNTYGAEGLGQLLRDFYSYSMPWWWPWSVVPFNKFMPWDAALRNYTAKSGSELYEEYKLAARQYWLAKELGPFLEKEGRSIISPSDTQEEERPENPFEDPLEDSVDHPHLPHMTAGMSPSFSTTAAIEVRGQNVYNFLRFSDGPYEVRMDRGSGVNPGGWTKLWKWPRGSGIVRAASGENKFYVTRDQDEDLNTYSFIHAFNASEDEVRLVLKRDGVISRLFVGRKHLLWLERHLEFYRLCQIPLKSAISGEASQAIECPLEARFPGSLSYLGQSFKDIGEERLISDEIWLRHEEETLIGNRHRIIRWSTEEDRPSILNNKYGGFPVSVSKGEDHYRLLLADRSYRFIRTVSLEGECLGQSYAADHLTGVHALADDQLLLTSWANQRHRIWQLDQNSLKQGPCQPAQVPISPLNYAMHKPESSFSQALAATHPWEKSDDETIRDYQTALASAPPLHKAHPEGEGEPEQRDASWRARPIFAFPWIGADAQGYQVGALTIPLMDNMQNETLRLSALYGVESRFPDTNLTLVSTRYRNTYVLEAFRRQTWNGSFRGQTYYYDERGAKVTASRFFYGPRISLRLGLKGSTLKPFLGRPEIWDLLHKGDIYEIDWSIRQRQSMPLGSLTYYLAGAVVPEEINNDFAYDKLATGVNYTLPIRLLGRHTHQSYGIDYGRTRGKKQRLLREVYRPLRTFIPGSGGGINEVNVSLTGPGALTSAVYGDSQARFRFAWTTPIVRDLETLLHIFYLERLDFTAFFNYGRAWFGSDIPDFSDFVKAHGYNIDLQSDIKGVTVNLGIGTGQVLGEKFEMYFLFGFDALIDQ